ncbi:hypothetical protein M5D96_014182, partial [Drosophila gunungcola]
MTKLREKIDLDQQMFTARNHLINSLQKTEQENRSKLDKRNCQVGEKDTLISQVNIELASKEEKSRNLFATLKFKQGGEAAGANPVAEGANIAGITIKKDIKRLKQT